MKLLSEKGETFFDAALERPELRALNGGVAAVWTRPWAPGEAPNEDAVALLELDGGRALLALADGCGGQPQGEKAAKLALQTLLRTVRESCSGGAELREAILNGLEEANLALRGQLAGSASTLAAVEIQGRVIRPYHVGDSEVLVAGARGKLKLRTISHSPTGYGMESGLLDERDALRHEERHLVSNLIGNEAMRIEVGAALELSERDTVLIASDGLWDNLHTDEILQRLCIWPLERAMTGLAEGCLKRMLEPREGKPSKPDDVSLVAYRPRKTVR
ncbi:MAG: hypothetical protein AMXMBFR7_34630 [Planctomycetota bacterium]